MCIVVRADRMCTCCVLRHRSMQENTNRSGPCSQHFGQHFMQQYTPQQNITVLSPTHPPPAPPPSTTPTTPTLFTPLLTPTPNSRLSTNIRAQEGNSAKSSPLVRTPAASIARSMTRDVASLTTPSPKTREWSTGNASCRGWV